MTFPMFDFPLLPTTTVVPAGNDLFIPYFNRTYEEIAFAVNFKDNNFYPMAITSTFKDILNVPNFGAFIICVSGEDAERNSSGVIIGWPPTITASLSKSDATAAGSVNVLGGQAGTGSWTGNLITFNATATNFQIKHDRTGVSGNFNLRVIGTQ